MGKNLKKEFFPLNPLHRSHGQPAGFPVQQAYLVPIADFIQDLYLAAFVQIEYRIAGLIRSAVENDFRGQQDGKGRILLQLATTERQEKRDQTQQYQGHSDQESPFSRRPVFPQDP